MFHTQTHNFYKNIDWAKNPHERVKRDFKDMTVKDFLKLTQIKSLSNKLVGTFNPKPLTVRLQSVDKTVSKNSYLDVLFKEAAKKPLVPIRN